MKTFFFSLLATFMFSFVGKAQDDQKIVSIVSLEEYVKMDLVDQKLVNYLDCAISALKGLHLTGSKNYSKYQASIGINLKSSDKLTNNIVISELDSETPNNIQSCTICGLRSGRTCFERIRTRLNNGQVIITVVLNGDCVNLTWD